MLAEPLTTQVFSLSLFRESPPVWQIGLRTLGMFQSLVVHFHLHINKDL